MKICKVNKTSCLGYYKETKECCSIENCKEQEERMEKEETIKIVEKIKQECGNHIFCNYCGFFSKKKRECIFTLMMDLDYPSEIELEDLLGDDE